MTTFYADWRAAKDKFFDAGLMTADLPPDFVMALSQGTGLGPALKTFDHADNYEKKAKSITAVLKAKTEYEKEIGGALKKVTVPTAKKALGELQGSLAALWMKVEQAAQPPRPSDQMVNATKLRTFDLAGGVKTKYLKLDPVKIDVSIEIDKELQRLIDAGQESLKVDHLGSVALAKLEKVRDDFRDAILKVDAAIAKDPSTQKEKTAEANEVLKHYGSIVRDQIDVAVQAEWQKYQQRKDYLQSFRIKSGVKIALGTIGLGVAAASIGLSFGTAWINIVVIVKGVAELAKTIKTLAEGIDTTYKQLVDDMAHVDELNQERDAAKAKQAKGGKGKSQAGSKAKEASKEVLAALLPITKDMIKASSAIDARCKQLLGQVSKLDTEADKLVGKLNAIVKGLSGLPDKEMTAAQKKVADQMGKTLDTLFTDIEDLNRKAQKCAAFGERSQKAVQKLRKEDSWTAELAEALGGTGTKAVAIYGLVNFIVECADHGKALIPM